MLASPSSFSASASHTYLLVSLDEEADLRGAEKVESESTQSFLHVEKRLRGENSCFISSSTYGISMASSW